MNYLNYPETFSWSALNIRKLLVPLSIKLSDRIICISKVSEKEIVKKFPNATNKTKVVYNALDEVGHDVLACKPLLQSKKNKKLNVEKPYILSVGTLNPHKNYERLLKAFSKIENSSVNLVIIGRMSQHGKSLRKLANNLGISSRVFFKGFVDKNTLHSYYSNALAFVMPSLYEGFGIPVIEAIDQGIPVVCSDIPIFREIANGAATFFDPENIDNIAIELVNIIRNSSTEERLKLKEKQIKSDFSWPNSANNVWKIYKEILA